MELKRTTKERINIIIDTDLNIKLSELSEEKGISKSSIICQLISNYFEEVQKTESK